jgi:hypothetical protein
MGLTRPKATQINFDVTNLSDPLIGLNKGKSGSNDVDAGIVIERGSDANVAIIWDESADQFAVINTSETGTTAGNVTITSYANIKANEFHGDGSNLTGVGGSYTHPNHSGDIVSSGDGATTIQAGAVDIAMLSATGTASSSTFLRGDNTWVTPTDTNTTYSSSDFTHDDLTGFVANEHIDWTSASAGTIHSSNYTDTNTTYSNSDFSLSGLSDTTVSTSDPTETSNPSAVGHLWINKSSGESFVCTDATSNANLWYNIGEGSGGVEAGGWGGSASGGTTSTYGNYTIHTFTSSGTFAVTTGGPIDYLVVAGGGGGGSHIGGGGGAGGMLTATNYTIASGNHSITIGGGGSGSTSTNDTAGDGGNTVFGSIATATGGGHGGSGYSDGGDGGSGGGVGHGTGSGGGTPGSGTSGQGNSGGNGNQTGAHSSGGGGGKSAVGGTGAQGGTAGSGGNGEQWNLDGLGYYYAGGGGGGGMNAAAGNGGQGGGGGGTSENAGDGSGGGSARNNGGAGGGDPAGNGGANTGGGGGGGGHGSQDGGNGGSGIVIIRYET